METRLHPDDIAAIAEATAQLLREDPPPAPRASRYLKIADLARELGLTAETIRRRMDEAGIPMRDAEGTPVERYGRYVSRDDWNVGRNLGTRAARRLAREGR